MTRIVAAAVLAVLLVPSGASAQNASFTVTTATADVHKGPSIGSPVIGKAARGSQLAVVRDVGDWLRVSWPDASDGVGYVQAKPGITRADRRPRSKWRRHGGSIKCTGPAIRGRCSKRRRSCSTIELAGRAHVIGVRASAVAQVRVGGLMNGSTIGFGASGRAWSRRRFGVQLELSQFSLTDASTLGRVNSLVFAPSLIFSLRNHVGDSVWVRPYLGAGAKLSHRPSVMDQRRSCSRRTENPGRCLAAAS